MFLSWWRRLVKKGSKVETASRRLSRRGSSKLRRQLWAEPLEDRTLLATSAFLSMPTNLSGNQGTTVTVPLSINHLFDAAGNQGLNAATVVLQVHGSNTAPVVADDDYAITHGQTFSSQTSGILSNDSDVDGDPLQPVLVSNVQHGALTLNADGTFLYTPDVGFTGSDSFTYKPNDHLADGAVATVTLTVTNQPPVATAAPSL